MIFVVLVRLGQPQYHADREVAQIISPLTACCVMVLARSKIASECAIYQDLYFAIYRKKRDDSPVIKPAASGVHPVSETPSGGTFSRYILAACPVLYEQGSRGREGVKEQSESRGDTGTCSAVLFIVY